jgi:hypothetical protein
MGLRFKATTETEAEAKTSTRPVFCPTSSHKETVTPKIQSVPLAIVQAETGVAMTQIKQRKKRRLFRMTKRQASVMLTVSLLFGLRWWQGAQLHVPAPSANSFVPVYQLNAPSANAEYIKAINKLSGIEKEDCFGDSKTFINLMEDNWQHQGEKNKVFDQVRLAMLQDSDSLEALSQATHLPYTPRYYPQDAGKYFKGAVVTPRSFSFLYFVVKF